MAYRFLLDSAFAEFIFAPFHDPEHSSRIPDKLEPGSATGLAREHVWCWTTINWSDATPGSNAFTYRFRAPFNIRHHDMLVLSLSMPPGATIDIALLGFSDQSLSGWVLAGTGKGHRQELKIPITRLRSTLLKIFGRRQFFGLALRCQAATNGPGVVAISWVGLQNSSLLERMHKQRSHLDVDWSPWLLPVSAWETPRFERALLFDVDMLAELRVKKTRCGWDEHFKLLEHRAQEYLRRNPEADLGDYLPNHDLRYLREHEQGRKAYHWEALVLAFVGLVNEDHALIQHALRYLMCMVHTRYWADSAEHRIPSSSWNQRAFMEEMTATSVALLADWLAFALSSQAKSLIRHALWDKGMTPVRRDLMQFEQMHRMNQGAVFCRAPILGGLYLEGAWPRARTVVDEAYEWMNGVLDHYVRTDGGVHEGIGYLCQMLTACLWAIIAYCRGRGLDWREVVVRRFGSVERYVRVMSASIPGQVIPAGDCRTEWLSGDAIPLMASIFPEGPFSDVLRSCLCAGTVHELTGTLTGSGGLIGMVYGPLETVESKNIVPQSDILPGSGKVTIRGETDDLAVRLWVSSSSSSATHAHRDHGQFCLEVNGEPTFIDRGMVEYWFTDAHLLSKSWMHNVLTLVLSDGTFADQKFADADEPIKLALADGCGRVDIVGNGVWRDSMTSYSRHFDVDLPATVKIIDCGNLRQAGQIAFHLHSPHAFSISDNRAMLVHGAWRAVIEFPWAIDLTCRQEKTDLLRRPIFHICAISPEQTDFFLLSSIRFERA